MTRPILRPADLGDAAAIGVVGYSAWLMGIGDHVGPEAHARINEATFSDFAKASHGQIVVAEVDGEVVGFAATEHGDNTISDVWVAPGVRGARRRHRARPSDRADDPRPGV